MTNCKLRNASEVIDHTDRRSPCSKSINLFAEQIVHHYLTQKRNFQLALFRMSAQFKHQLIGNWPLPLGRLRGEQSLKIHFGFLKLQKRCSGQLQALVHCPVVCENFSTDQNAGEQQKKWTFDLIIGKQQFSAVGNWFPHIPTGIPSPHVRFFCVVETW